MIKVIELFAGIGSQREALKRANIEHEIVAISENDKYASKAYVLLHGPTNNLGDIKNIVRLPKADLWTYSFPCTDISLAGKMKGFDKGSNTHSSLLWEVQRLLVVAKEKNELPKYLLMENVKNIVTKKFMPLFHVWLDYLDSLGYKNFYKILNAKDYGIPQNRERCFMISIRDKDAHYEFPKPTPLTKKLAELLENDVDEKYFLSEKLITCFTDMNDRHGLNLQEGGHQLVWFSLTWSLELYQQTIGRLYRQGQKSKSVVVTRIVAKDTIDEDVIRALDKKERTQDALIEAVKAHVKGGKANGNN